MNTYYLIRHGQDQDNQQGLLNGQRDRTLTEIGINQAVELSKTILKNKMSFDTVLVSPLNRAYTTASIVAGINNAPTPVIEDLLIERNFGIMTGKKLTDIIPMCGPDIIQVGNLNNFLNPKDAETFPDLINRANNLLEKLENEYTNKKIMLVSHGDFGKMLYCAYYKLDWKKVLSTFQFGNSEMILLSQNTNPNQAKIITIEQFNV